MRVIIKLSVSDRNATQSGLLGCSDHLPSCVSLVKYPLISGVTASSSSPPASKDSCSSAVHIII